MPLTQHIQTNFGSPQSSVGWQLYDSSGLIGGVEVTGISMPIPGIYVATADISQAVGVQWTCGNPALTRQQDLITDVLITSTLEVMQQTLFAMITMWETDPDPNAPANAVRFTKYSLANMLAMDLGGGINDGSLNERTVRSALRFLRNAWSVTGGVLTVNKENDTTPAWTAAITSNAAAVPITGSDPA